MTRPMLDVNMLVRVDVGQPGAVAAVAVPSRVEGTVGGDLLLAAPHFAGDAVTTVPGAALTLRWPSERGMHAMEAALVDVEGGRVRRWRVRPTGASELVQRRRFVRAAMDNVIAVVPVVDGLTRVIGGWLIDLGEGGARARVELSERLDPGSRVEVHLTLEERPVALTGTVLRVDTSDPTRQRLCDVVLAFDDPVPHARRIRRSVLRRQMQARRGEAT